MTTHVTRPRADRTNRILYYSAIGLAVLGLFSIVCTVASIIGAVVAGVRGERRAWWIIPVALLVSLVHIALLASA